MAAITKVPNGPLIKKKGPFKGSTLKSGGVVKKAQEGATMSPYMQKRAAQQLVKEKNIRARDSILNRNASAKGMTREQVQAQQVADKKKPDAVKDDLTDCGKRTKKTGSCVTGETGGGQSTKDNKRNGGPVKKAQNGVTKDSTDYFKKQIKGYDQLIKNEKNTPIGKSNNIVFMDAKSKSYDNLNRQSLKGKKGYDKNGYPIKKKAKAGAMIKRADGSMSKRGLWDNIRANKGSGKKPTKQMLVQEKKIKAKSKK